MSCIPNSKRTNTKINLWSIYFDNTQYLILFYLFFAFSANHYLYGHSRASTTLKWKYFSLTILRHVITECKYIIFVVLPSNFEFSMPEVLHACHRRKKHSEEKKNHTIYSTTFKSLEQKNCYHNSLGDFFFVRCCCFHTFFLPLFDHYLCCTYKFVNADFAWMV